MSSYISYMGTDDIITDYASITAIEAEDVTVTGDIEVGGLVDGVDISTLAAEVKDLEAKSGSYVTLNTTQTITGRKTFTADFTHFSNPSENAVLVQGGVAARYITTQPYGSANFQSLSTFHQNMNVKENILMVDGKTVDGVDVSELPAQIANNSTDIGNLDTRVGDVENKVNAIEEEINSLSTDYVDKKTAQIIGGVKTFTSTINANDNIVMQPGKTVDGVDVSALDTRVVTLENKDYKDFVTINTEQTIDGKKLFTQPITIRSYAGNGLIVTGMGIRTGGRAQQMMLSDGDGVAEMFFGSEVDGKGISDYNYKWGISSRDRTNGKLIFYRCPNYTTGTPGGYPGPGGFEEVMSLQNIRDDWNGDYAVINMEKKVNFRGGMTVSDSNFFEYKLGSGSDPAYNDYMYIQIQRVANIVTMTVSIPQSRVLSNAASILSATALPAKYRPSNGDVSFIASLAPFGTFDYRTVLAAVTSGGVITVWAQMNPSSGTFGVTNVRINSFTVSWITGLNPA